MNIHGTKDKLAISKTFVRDLNPAEWELVGGGSAGESFNCPTYYCTQTCPTVNCSQTCPSAACPVTYACPSNFC
jgi:hypothetical protein